MARRKRLTPSYRLRSGYDQAIVTLSECETRHRRDYWLGRYDSLESREVLVDRCDRVLGQLLRALPARGLLRRVVFLAMCMLLLR